MWSNSSRRLCSDSRVLTVLVGTLIFRNSASLHSTGQGAWSRVKLGPWPFNWNRKPNITPRPQRGKQTFHLVYCGMFCDTQNTFPFLPISDIYAIFVKGTIVALASYGLAFPVSLKRARSMKFQVWTSNFWEIFPVIHKLFLRRTLEKSSMDLQKSNLTYKETSFMKKFANLNVPTFYLSIFFSKEHSCQIAWLKLPVYHLRLTRFCNLIIADRLFPRAGRTLQFLLALKSNHGSWRRSKLGATNNQAPPPGPTHWNAFGGLVLAQQRGWHL